MSIPTGSMKTAPTASEKAARNAWREAIRAANVVRRSETAAAEGACKERITEVDNACHETIEAARAIWHQATSDP